MTTSFSVREQNDAHELIQKWRAENEDGFILNRISAASGMIHRTRCQHLGDATWSKDEKNDLGQKQKVCALSIASLHDWAKSHGVNSLSNCGDCQPVPADGEELVAAEAKALNKNGYFDPDGIIDTRPRVARETACRQGQPAFRRELLKAYGERCAITGCDQQQVLDAAHIIAYSGPETNHVQNGLLLRTDIHTLFDLRLIAIDTASMTVLVHHSLEGTEYELLSGLPLRQPATESQSPNKIALDRQREKTGLTSPCT